MRKGSKTLPKAMTASSIAALGLKPGDRIAVWTRSGELGPSPARVFATVAAAKSVFGSGFVVETHEGKSFVFTRGPRSALPLNSFAAFAIEKLAGSISFGRWVEVLDVFGKRWAGVLRGMTPAASPRGDLHAYAWLDEPAACHRVCREFSLSREGNVRKLEKLPGARWFESLAQLATVPLGSSVDVSSRTWIGCHPGTGRVTAVRAKLVSVKLGEDGARIEINTGGDDQAVYLWKYGPPDEGIAVCSDPPAAPSGLRRALETAIVEREAKRWRSWSAGRAAAARLFAKRVQNEWTPPSDDELAAAGESAVVDEARAWVSALKDEQLAQEAVKAAS